jgi:flagellar basal-body rod protein FlgB
MVDSIFNDPSYSIAKLALDGLSQRQNIISNNIANVDTPGYSAKTVDFASTLQKAVNEQDQLAMNKTDSRHLASPTDSVNFAVTDRPGGTERADGNNVDINVELTDMSETGVKYQALTASVSLKLQLLKDIAQSR